MRKILISFVVLALGVTLGVSGLAAQGGRPLPPQPSKIEVTAKNVVNWSIFPFIELLVSADSYTFPELKPGTDEYEAKNAITLIVLSNTDWALSYEVQGDEEVVSHLSVSLSKTSGSWNAKVPVTYKLSDLREMAPGTYQVTVVYTASAE